MNNGGITVYLQERLGNQLFMYAAALEQARRLGCTLHANLSSFPNSHGLAYTPRYGLDGFDHGMVIEPDLKRHPRLRRYEPSARKLRFWERRLPKGIRVFEEGSFLYDPDIEQVTPGTTLVGYYQSWRYFRNTAEELRRRLTTLKSPSDWYQQTRRLIGQKGTVALGVRRGNYRLPWMQRRYGLLPAAYYARAVELVRRLGVHGPVFVVSDEVEAVMSELQAIKGLQPVAPPPNTDPLEIILAMSEADAVVMGNSSFYWWPAWIHDRPDRPVIAPRPWFNMNDLSERDMLLPHWISLEARDLA